VRSHRFFRDPTILQEIVNSFMFRGFTSFVLIIIDHLGSEGLDSRFFARKLIFFSILLVVEIASPILYNEWEVFDMAVVPHSLVLFVNTYTFVFAVVIILNVADPILNRIPSSETAPGSSPSTSHHFTRSCSS
jgi:hypothetical protein